MLKVKEAVQLQWVQEKRLSEARHLIEKRTGKRPPSTSTWDLKASLISRMHSRKDLARHPLNGYRRVEVAGVEPVPFFAYLSPGFPGATGDQ